MRRDALGDPGIRFGRVAGALFGATLAALAAWLLLRAGRPPEGASPPAGGAADLPAVPRPAFPSPGPAPSPGLPPDPPCPGVAAAPAHPEESQYPEDPAAVPLRVVVRDGTTGDPVRGATLALVPDLRPMARLTPRPPGDAHMLVGTSPLRRAQSAALRVEARLPEGYVAEWKESLWIRGTIARFAEEVDATLIVWPEAKVSLTVEESDGRPAVGATLGAAHCGTGTLEARAEPADARGEMQIRGIPFLRGEYVQAVAELDDRWAASERVRLEGTRDECSLRLRAVLPRAAPKVAFGVGGGAGGMFGGRGGKPRNLVLGETGSVDVRVLRRDGRPAPGVAVVLDGREQVADDEGRAVFAGVLPGTYLATVREPGFLVEAQVASVVVGIRASVELGQREGVSLAVTVLDAEGGPVPGAALSVAVPEFPGWCLMRGDTQVLGIHTDREGRASLPGLPGGPVKVTARFGTREASETAEAGGAVEIRLPPPR